MGFTDPNYWKQSPPPQTGDMNNERYLNQKAVLELPGAQAPQELSIADGRISPTRSAIVVDTEGGGAADDLEVINTAVGSGTETLHNGMLITLRAKDQARVVTVKNSAAANGINTADGNDIVLSTAWELTLRLVGGRWYEVPGRASAQAAEAQEDASTALGRTDPATTTSRGIARVATLADMEPDAVIENGPAFLAAGVHTSVAAAAGKVPVANASGKVPEWAFDVGDLMPSFSTAKSGFLLCNGGAYSRTTYSALFAILGTSFGAGDGSTTFNVPDFRGRTIQGANANLKAVLNAGLPNVTGVIGLEVNTGTTATGAFYITSALTTSSSSAAITKEPSVGINLSKGNSIYGASTTVQPPAIAANIFIKY